VATPMIWNSDQGSHFTSPHYLQLLQEAQVKISMDSKGRAIVSTAAESWLMRLFGDSLVMW